MQPQQRFHLKCSVHGVLQRPDGKVFLIRRFNTGYGDGKFSLPAGHLDDKESVTQATVREIQEETGVVVQPKDLKIVHVMHSLDENDAEFIVFFFLATKWTGEPHLAEPDKSDEVVWVSPQQLPENTVRYIRFFFDQYKAGNIYSEFGWK